MGTAAKQRIVTWYLARRSILHLHGLARTGGSFSSSGNVLAIPGNGCQFRMGITRHEALALLWIFERHGSLGSVATLGRQVFEPLAMDSESNERSQRSISIPAGGTTLSTRRFSDEGLSCKPPGPRSSYL